MVSIALLEVLLNRNVAVLLLRFSNTYPVPVTYDELLTKLRDKFVAKRRESPSEATVKAELGFLVREELLEEVGVEYRITPSGVEATAKLSPHTVTSTAITS